MLYQFFQKVKFTYQIYHVILGISNRKSWYARCIKNLWQSASIHIQYKKLVLVEQKGYVVVTQQKDKSKNPFRSFFKPCCTFVWNFKLFPTASKSKEVGKLIALGTKSDDFLPSKNKLGETLCIVFVTVVLKTWNNVLSVVFYCFFNCFSVC